MARRRAKPAQVADQRELDFARPPAPAKPTRTPTDIEQAARLAIARLPSEPEPATRCGSL